MTLPGVFRLTALPPLPASSHAIELGSRRLLAPGRWRWLRALAWMIGFIFLVALTAFPAREAIEHALPRSGPNTLLSTCIGVAIAFAVYALGTRIAEDRRPSEFALRPMVPEVLAGLAIGAAMFASVMAILIATGLYETRLIGAAPVSIALGHAIESGVVEEMMIRAIMLRLAWRAFGPIAAFAISGAAFGLGHLANPGATVFSAVALAIEAGVMLGAFYALTGRVWVSIGVHAAWNFTQGYVFGAAVSGGDFGPAIAHSSAVPGYADWMTGGAFGPEASLTAFVVCTAVGAVTLVCAWRAHRLTRNGYQAAGEQPLR